MKFTVLFFALSLAIGAVAQQSRVNRVRLSIPGVKGILEIDVGTATPKTRVRPDGREVQLQAFGRADGLEITAFLQKVTFRASPEKCLAEWWPGTKNATPLQRDHLEESTRNGIARVEYIVPEFQKAKVQQKNIHAYLGGGDLCAELHLSKAEFNVEDQELFERVLETVKLFPDETETSTQSESLNSAYYFAEGSKFYLQQDYSHAAGSYQKALDLEKKNRALAQDLFRVLVDNLGMSYGISGNLPQAKQTFEYGIGQDPKYPMFYYNLACTYGEMDRMNESLEQLQLAYKFKENMITGEKLPDPLRDDSFRKFIHNEQFVNTVREWQQHQATP